VSELRSTKRQRELLTFVDGFIQGHGYGPSYREIMRALGYKSVSTVAIHIEGLISKGYLNKRDNSARSLEVVTMHLDDASSHKTASPSQEKWIINAVTERFEKLESESSTKDDGVLDELYVLIGALKILGLEEAHVAMKSRLASLLKHKTEI
jgi:repressor LexA